MDKAKINYVIDIGLIISFFVVFITGIIKFRDLMLVIGLDYRGLPIAQLSVLHDWFGLIMGILVLFHLILHFNWLKCMTKNIFKSKEKTCDTN
jgi:cytochrome b subunit of formate dehydrogenase